MFCHCHDHEILLRPLVVPSLVVGSISAHFRKKENRESAAGWSLIHQPVVMAVLRYNPVDDWSYSSRCNWWARDQQVMLVLDQHPEALCCGPGTVSPATNLIQY